MLNGEFSAADYKSMKIEIEYELEKLTREVVQIRHGIENYDNKIDDCLDLLLNLDKYYSTKNTDIKQKIIGSVFPAKLVFSEKKYRTTKLNELVALLCITDKGLGQKKEGRKLIFQFLPSEWIRRDEFDFHDCALNSPFFPFLLAYSVVTLSNDFQN